MKKVGVLFLHGFTGGPFEIRPLYRFLSARTNWVLRSPTLTGHGIPLQLDHPYATAEHWMYESKRAYEELAQEVDEVIVVGFSMGGLLAIQLSQHYPIKALVLLSAAAKYGQPQLLMNDLYIKLQAEKKRMHYPQQTFFHLYDYKLQHTSIRATLHFLDVLRATRPCFRKIQTPTLIVHGRKDGIVPFSSSLMLYNFIQHQEKQLIASDEGKHHICYSLDAEGWFHHVLRFLKRQRA